MDFNEKLSKAAQVGEIYNLDHFDLAWSNEKLRRLMGNELVYPPSPKVIQAIQGILEKVLLRSHHDRIVRKLDTQGAHGLEGRPAT